MTEDEAQAWLRDELSASCEAMEKLASFRRMVIEENQRQNLISEATIAQFWARHIVDSAQLLLFAHEIAENWIDLGAGAGFPGIIIAILRDAPITLVESRRKRSDFLRESAEKLAVPHVTIEGSRLESIVPKPFSVISARAFAPLPRLLELAHSFSTEKTLWILPKGRSAREELESAQRSWHGVFHVKQSVTSPDAAIIIARVVQRKGRP